MKTNIEVDERIVKDILKLTNISAKNLVMTEALNDFLKYLRRRDMMSLRGKIQWEGDLEAMRTD